MRFARGFVVPLGIAVIAICGEQLTAQETERLPADPRAAVVEAEYEVLTRGPLHEAFAQPYNSEPIPGVTIDAAPPNPIEELPPEVAPAGENVTWVAGYWGWEPEEETFIWISGIWRKVPPGQTWVPGYWTEVDDEYQWVSGFWTNEDNESVVYLPYPPETLEEGPIAPPPGGNHFWVPGVWQWVADGYQWRPGFWSRAYEDWVWIPSHYAWTPYGCIYVGGYWDHRPTERGLVFAPVYFRPAVLQRRIVRYSPSVVIQTPRTLVHWFVSPRYHHYYFGNYYGRRFEQAQVNLVPWYAYETRLGYYDPLLTHYRWYYARRNVDFLDRLERWYEFYAFYDDRRPPVSFAQQRALFTRLGDGAPSEATSGHFRLAETVQSVAAEPRFRRLQQERRQQLAEAAVALREMQQRRNRVERAAAQEPAERSGVETAQPLRRLELPRQAAQRLQLDADTQPAEPQEERPAVEDQEQAETTPAEEPGDEAPPARQRADREQPETARERRQAREERQPADEPQREAAEVERQRPDRPRREPPDRRGQVDQLPGRVQPPTPAERPQARPRRAGRPDAVPGGRGQRAGEQPAEASPTRPDAGQDRAPGTRPRRGQPLGFDGRNLPYQLQLDPEQRAAPRERAAERRRYQPFQTQPRPDDPGSEPEADRRRPARLGPLDDAPPEMDRQQRDRIARPEVRRGPQRQDRDQRGRPPQREPAADEQQPAEKPEAGAQDETEAEDESQDDDGEEPEENGGESESPASLT